MNAESFLRNRGVTRLCHFTKLKNLVHIIAGNEGILASSAIRPDTQDAKDPERYDGELDYVCCSVEYPNSWYLVKAQKRDADQIFKGWVVVFIDLSVLECRMIKFCPCNAAKNRGAYIQDDISQIGSLFASPNVRNWTRPPRMLTCCPTDDQAEILIKGNIPSSFIKGIGVCCQDDAKIAYSMLKTFGKSDIPIYMAPDVLDTKWSTQVRAGIRPDEIYVFDERMDS